MLVKGFTIFIQEFFRGFIRPLRNFINANQFYQIYKKR